MLCQYIMSSVLKFENCFFCNYHFLWWWQKSCKTLAIWIILHRNSGYENVMFRRWYLIWIANGVCIEWHWFIRHSCITDWSTIAPFKIIVKCLETNLWFGVPALFFLFASSLAFSALVLYSFHQHFAMGRGNKAKLVREEDRAEAAASASRRITKTCLLIQWQIASMTLSDS